MRNFEKDFDRLLNNLQEATHILKECNLEMQKCLGETKDIMYCIFEPETETYYRQTTDMQVTKLKLATLYATIAHANQIREMLESRDGMKYQVKIVQLKVVE